MYNVRVGIISEGQTDQDLISRIISAELPDQSFVFTGISPTEDEIDSNSKVEGFGWGGVYKVCKHLKDKMELLRAAGMMFDLLVIHIDGDVMMLTYESTKIQKDETDGLLPCYSETSSITDNCLQLQHVVESWIETKEKNNVICIPHINSDAWAAYALYQDHRSDITQEMTKEDLLNFLLDRTRKEGRLIRKHDGRIRKETRSYRTASNAITPDLLQSMKDHFSQLDLFCKNILDVLAKKPAEI